ncbi:MAG: hypothetical protein J7L39_03225 [Candidatus Aenigmarchaeota archaeon]|nr:hypothetical protein [Candidatus Aenigmarchaeota archaeon]
MSQELTKNLMCIAMRNGAEIWIERSRIEDLIKNLTRLTENKFIKVGDELINTADIVGIFTPKTMEEIVRRRNGQWQCKYGTWHQKGEKCNCAELKKYGVIN